MKMVKRFLKLKVFPIDTKYMGAISFMTIFLYFILPFLFRYMKINELFAGITMLILIVVSASCSLRGIFYANGKNLAICWLLFLLFLFYCGCVLRIAYH